MKGIFHALCCSKAPQQRSLSVSSSSLQLYWRLHRQGEHKVAEAGRQAVRLLRVWQRSDSHERLLRSLPSLRYADWLPTPLPSTPLSIFFSPSFILPSPSLKLLIDSFTPARAQAHLGQTSITRADFLINCKFTPVHTVLHSPYRAKQWS